MTRFASQPAFWMRARTVTISSWMIASPFSLFVVIIVCLRPCKQVRKITARRGITTMQAVKPFGDLSNNERVCNSMGWVCLE